MVPRTSGSRTGRPAAAPGCCSSFPTPGLTVRRCQPMPQTCLVSATGIGKVALWSFDRLRSRDGDSRLDPPAIEIDPDGPGPRTVLSGDRPGVLQPRRNTRLLVSDGHNGWQVFPARTGGARRDHRRRSLYAIIRIDGAVGLWTTDSQLLALRARTPRVPATPKPAMMPAATATRTRDGGTVPLGHSRCAARSPELRTRRWRHAVQRWCGCTPRR